MSRRQIGGEVIVEIKEPVVQICHATTKFEELENGLNMGASTI
jgi:hypothetical protein